MSFTSLPLPFQTYVIENSSSISLTQNITTITGSNQIFDWISIASPFVNPGEVYYKSIEDGNWYLASTATSESINSLVVIEAVSYNSPSSSLAKGVYFGKITFDSSSISLTDGASYYLSTSSLNTNINVGPLNFRNTTTIFPSASIVKTIFVATSAHEGVILNYRGYLSQ